MDVKRLAAARRGRGQFQSEGGKRIIPVTIPISQQPNFQVYQYIRIVITVIKYVVDSINASVIKC